MLMRITRACFDIVFPPSKDMLLVRRAPLHALNPFITPRAVGNVVALLPFQEPLVRACIHEAKFHHNTKAIKMLGLALHAYLTQQERPVVLIPIPLSRARLRERGYNQVEVVIKEALTNLPDCTLINNVLVRIKHTTPQTKLPKEKRRENVAGAFKIREEKVSKLRGTHIILIDDVVTTGTTMNTARSTIAQCSPASLTCLALAH